MEQYVKLLNMTDGSAHSPHPQEAAETTAENECYSGVGKGNFTQGPKFIPWAFALCTKS